MTLTEIGEFHESMDAVDTHFGVWNEVGKDSKFLESEVGDYTYFDKNCDVVYTEIGKFCSIARGVRINPGNHPMDRPSQHHFTYRRKMFGMDNIDDMEFFNWRKDQKVVIGHDVWIGHKATIMPGVIDKEFNMCHGAII